MDILSRKIKIPNKRIKLEEVKHAFNIWEEPTDKILSIFYKEDDKQLLDEKWDIITLFLEEKLAGTGFLPLINELVLFTKGKKELKSAHFFFVDKKIPKSEYFKHSLSDFKKNYYRANEESELIQNTFRIDFEQQLFGNSSFWLVKEYEGVIDRSKINWNFRCETTILPVKFSNENSNGIINLRKVFYHLYLPRTTNNILSIVKRRNFLRNLGLDSYYSLKKDELESFYLQNIVSRELHSLQGNKKMPEDTKKFFDNLVVSDGVFSESRGVNFITLESGENYFVTLS